MTTHISNENIQHPRSKSAFQTIKTLVGLYVLLNLGTLVVAFVLRNKPDLVTDAVWVRGTILFITSLLLFSFASQLSKGARKAYLRVRILSAILFASVVVILAIPGDFPMWMKLEQTVCGLLLLGIVVIVNGNHLRTMFK